jgi:hypothetical protein
MMAYAGIMGKDRLKEYPIGDERLLWEEYLIIMGIVYFILIIRGIYGRISKGNTD